MVAVFVVVTLVGIVVVVVAVAVGVVDVAWLFDTKKFQVVEKCTGD